MARYNGGQFGWIALLNRTATIFGVVLLVMLIVTAAKVLSERQIVPDVIFW